MVAVSVAGEFVVNSEVMLCWSLLLSHLLADQSWRFLLEVFCLRFLLVFIWGIMNFGLKCGCAEQLSISWLLLWLNKIEQDCHPRQRPRWQIDKDVIGLSRVQQYSIYVQPAPLRYLAILFLIIFTHLAFTQFVDNLFHSIYCPFWEWVLSAIQSTLIFH